MNRRVISGTFLLFVIACVTTSARALTSSRDSRSLPAPAVGVLAKDADAYRNRRAWVNRAQAAKRARAEASARPGVQALATPLSPGLAITGTMNVPVLVGYFGSGPGSSIPFTDAALETQLFGSNPTGSVSDYYDEVSYGQFTIDGIVRPWFQVAQNNTFYAGTSQGLTPGNARTGTFIEELLDANDASINFGLYDNDGPDGIPNSGDDDGFVDVLCVVQSLRGAECGLVNNIQSHAWRYSAWPNSGGAPYPTNDPRFGGGFIRVDDYNITSALSCITAPTTITEIGTLCHELGHGLGLPDLYGVNPANGAPTGDKGAGDWSLMATGNWNTPASPAHFDAWCKTELGWLVPSVVSWQPTLVDIPAVETDGTAYMLPFTDERFRRSTACVIDGAYSFYCGLPQAEGTARGWDSPGLGGGYGSNWHQTIEREFTYSGSGAVSFQFDCAFDLELGFDFAFAIIEVNGTETVLVTHTGTGGGHANAPLGPALAPLAGAGGTYTLRFRVTSDESFDDADGQVPSDCGAFVFDNVSVTGGGETYSNNFEVNGGGWFQDPARNPISEYWLVENRRRLGFDQGLHGEGLLIWHVDEEVMHAPFQVNNGVLSATRGLVLEEADGDFDLNDGINSNRGEPGDVYGAPAETTFDTTTDPDSDDNTARTTQIAVTGIGAPSASMTATMRAGDPAPTAASVTPNVIDNDQVAVVVDVVGTRIRHGATFRFVKSAAALATSSVRDDEDVVATSLEWVDAAHLRGTVNVYSKTSGMWDLVVTNPDGQTVTLPDAVMLNHIVATKLLSAAIDVVSDGVRLRYQLIEREEGEELRLHRSTRADGPWKMIADDLSPVHGDLYEFVDDQVEAGRSYYYVLESVQDGVARELHRGVAVVPARELVLEQNHPNPFNPRTSIRFYLPERGPISLEIYDVQGALVRRLANGDFDSGPHTVDWDGSDAHGQPVASGLYMYRLVTDRRAITKKMMLLK